MATKKKTTVKEWLAEIDEGAANIGTSFMRADEKLRGQVIKALAARVTPRKDDDLWNLSYIEKDERAVDAICAIAKKSKGALKATAIAVLGCLNKPRQHFVPIFIDALKDASAEVRDDAIDALASYKNPAAVEPLKELLAKEQKKRGWTLDNTATNIMCALAECSKGSDDVIDILTAHLEPDDRYDALPIYNALTDMKKKGKRAIPKLEAVAENSVEIYLSTLARRALVAITGDPTPHVKALKAGTKIRDSATRSVAKRAVEEIAQLTKKKTAKKK